MQRTVKNPSSPRGAYLTFEVLKGGLKEREVDKKEGAYLKKLRSRIQEIIFMILYISSLYLK